MNDRSSVNTFPAYVNIMIGTVVFFCLFSFLFFLVTYICYFGLTDNMMNMYEKLLILNIKNPLNFQHSYALCFDLMRDLSFAQAIFVRLFLVMLCVLFFFAVVGYAKYNLVESYRKVFAEESVLNYFRLFSGIFHFLGIAYKKPLHLPFNNSVLSFGAKDSFDYLPIIAPSIFNDDECNMVIIDCNGELQKLTAGYRGLLGKTLCYNWEDKDEKTKGNFLPSWNPLSSKLLPSDVTKREKYISVLANALLSPEKTVDDVTSLCLQCIIMFFIAKTEKASANDYFLNTLLRNKRFDDDDRVLLMNHYLMMPDDIVSAAKNSLAKEELSAQNYIPVGSWENIVEKWQGQNLCLAMIYDTIQKNFSEAKAFAKKNSENQWRVVLKQYSDESELFYYPENVRSMLSVLLEKNNEEIDRCFAAILAAMDIFKNQNIREKTIFSDFSYDEIRGFSADDAIYPTTLYLSARSDDEKNISKILLNVLISETIEKYQNQNPIVFLINDTENFGYINSLYSGLKLGERANVSFLLFNNNIDNFITTYKEKEFKDILMNSAYITIFADTKEKLKNLLSTTATSRTQRYIYDISLAIDKLAEKDDNNAIVIAHNEEPLFIQAKFLSKEKINTYYKKSILPFTPYIDEFVKSSRPAFFETFSVPKSYEEKTVVKRGRKKKTPSAEGDNTWSNQASDDETQKEKK